MPNFPTALRKPPPEHKGRTTKDTILETLPDVGTTVNGMAVLRLLSQKSTDHVSLDNIKAHVLRRQYSCFILSERYECCEESECLCSIISLWMTMAYLHYVHLSGLHNLTVILQEKQSVHYV